MSRCHKCQNEVAIHCNAVNYQEECRVGLRNRKQDCIIVMMTLLA